MTGVLRYGSARHLTDDNADADRCKADRYNSAARSFYNAQSKPDSCSHSAAQDDNNAEQDDNSAGDSSDAGPDDSAADSICDRYGIVSGPAPQIQQRCSARSRELSMAILRC